MNRFEEIRFGDINTQNQFGPLDEQPLRVKIWKWFSPIESTDDGNTLVFDAHTLASRWGNRQLNPSLNQDTEAQLALHANPPGMYFKTAVGLLAVRDEILLVRLMTGNMCGAIAPMVQHALIDTRENPQGEIQVKFR